MSGHGWARPLILRSEGIKIYFMQRRSVTQPGAATSTVQRGPNNNKNSHFQSFNSHRLQDVKITHPRCITGSLKLMSMMRSLQKVQHCLVKELFSLTSEVRALRSLLVPDKIHDKAVRKNSRGHLEKESHLSVSSVSSQILL